MKNESDFRGHIRKCTYKCLPFSRREMLNPSDTGNVWRVAWFIMIQGYVTFSGTVKRANGQFSHSAQPPDLIALLLSANIMWALSYLVD